MSYVPGITNGYYSPSNHRIVVSEILSGNHKAKTAVHELVHSRVHRNNNETKEEQESVAEGASLLGSTPVTGYSTNAGVISITGIASRRVFIAAGFGLFYSASLVN